jgi:hypothetical protein
MTHTLCSVCQIWVLGVAVYLNAVTRLIISSLLLLENNSIHHADYYKLDSYFKQSQGNLRP